MTLDFDAPSAFAMTTGSGSSAVRRAPTHRRSLSSPADAFASSALANSLLTNDDGRQLNYYNHHHQEFNDDEEDEDEDVIDWDRAPMDVKELATRDPKRARRILANRLSAARSKARKVARANALARALEALTREEEALERERERLTRDVATLGAENSALEMMIFSDGGGGRGSGRGGVGGVRADCADDRGDARERERVQ